MAQTSSVPSCNGLCEFKHDAITWIIFRVCAKFSVGTPKDSSYLETKIVSANAEKSELVFRTAYFGNVVTAKYEINKRFKIIGVAAEQNGTSEAIGKIELSQQVYFIFANYLLLKCYKEFSDPYFYSGDEEYKRKIYNTLAQTLSSNCNIDRYLGYGKCLCCSEGVRVLFAESAYVCECKHTTMAAAHFDVPTMIMAIRLGKIDGTPMNYAWGRNFVVNHPDDDLCVGRSGAESDIGCWGRYLFYELQKIIPNQIDELIADPLKREIIRNYANGISDTDQYIAFIRQTQSEKLDWFAIRKALNKTLDAYARNDSEEIEEVAEEEEIEDVEDD